MRIFTPCLFFQCVFTNFQCVITLLRALSVALLSDTFSTSPLKPYSLNGILWNLTGSKISTSSTKFVFFGLIGLIGWFSTSPLKPQNKIQQNLTGSKMRMSSTKFVFCGPIGKTRWPPWPLIDWDIFFFFAETAEQNSTKLDREQDLIVLHQVCVFQADWKNKMAVLASDWLRNFGTSLLKPLKGIQRKLTTRGPKGHISCTWLQCATFLRYRPGPFLFTDPPEKYKLGKGHPDLTSCQVSLNYVQQFQRRSRKCFSQSEAMAAILFFRSARKTQTWYRTLRCCFLSSFVEFRSEE